MTKKFNLLASVAVLSLSIMALPAYANTITSSAMTKTTTLTNQNNINFSKTFNNKSSDDNQFSFSCVYNLSNKTCEVADKKTGFPDSLPKFSNANPLEKAAAQAVFFFLPYDSNNIYWKIRKNR